MSNGHFQILFAELRRPFAAKIGELFAGVSW